MLRDSDIDLVRSSVTMKQLAEAYGFTVTRHGKMKCPFHNDNDPSMQTYKGDGGFYCFVCKKGGSIFTFVKEYEGIGFEDAVIRIAGMFGIPIQTEKAISDEEYERMARKRAERKASEKALERSKRELRDLGTKISQYRSLQAEFMPLSDIWCRLENMINKAEIQWEDKFNSIFCGSN